MLVCLGVAASRIVSILAARDRAVFWRGGRAVEGAALEMLFRGDSNEGSNPSLSANKYAIAVHSEFSNPPSAGFFMPLTL